MKKATVGILAHVDAGKTTLSEALLYFSGQIGAPGRVDKRDTYLDTHPIERERGITIFSKQATLELANTAITLIDTPGHVDFSCEAERALAVQDYAILIVNAADGVTAHTKTLWHLLAAARVPTFIFVNKTDISERRRAHLLDELRCVLSPYCVDFTEQDTPDFYEAAASCDERLMEQFFDGERLTHGAIAESISRRRIFPCLFGSALKLRGVKELMELLDEYIIDKKYSESIFGARVYKISRDQKDRRLSYAKITGASVKTKDAVSYRLPNGQTITEKVEEIRIYSGDKYKSVSEAGAGTVCALLGLSATTPGMGLGAELSCEQSLSPVLSYRMILPEGANAYETYMRLLVLSEEDPSLGLAYDHSTREIRVRLMGEIQTEVLTGIICDRFGLSVSFDSGAILYKETVAAPVQGAGHFEPLRHYAEVHLRIEPLEAGSGIVVASECPTDTLALNWQRLIQTHLEERVHRGVLTGAPLTDVRITLTAGRAHLKHTEGGDFRQATYRAVRQGLMKGESVLLEPTFDFKINAPRDYLGRIMNDITNMHGSMDAPEFDGDSATVTGCCPVYTMRSYPSELRAFTRGEGRIAMTVGEYAPCHNAAEIIAASGYDPLLDERNPAGSVFCKGGAGYAVPWNEADALMHITPTGAPADRDEPTERVRVAPRQSYRGTVEEDRELMRIFESTYGRIKPRKVAERVENAAAAEEKPRRPKRLAPRGEDFVIVDGYNFIFGCDGLREEGERDLARARDMVVRRLCDYTAFKKCRAIVVFDAYKREGGEGSVEQIGGVSVVYTKEKQTADAYIEKATYDMSGEHTVRVVTSDMQEQLVVLGSGGLRVSAREFMQELEQTARLIEETARLLSASRAE